MNGAFYGFGDDPAKNSKLSHKKILLGMFLFIFFEYLFFNKCTFNRFSSV